VFANTAAEENRVRAAEDGEVCADVFSDPIGEHLDGQRHTLIVGCLGFELVHVA